MKDDKSKDDGETRPNNAAPRKLRIKTSARPPAPDPPETPCTVVID
jgi:hypothetical protein